MKKILPLVVLLALAAALPAQATFQKVISLDTLNIFATDACELPDGSFAIGGLTGQIIKLSPAGDLLWARRLGDSLVVAKIACTADGSIIVRTLTDGPLSNSYQALIKLDAANGEIEWDKRLGVMGNPFLESLLPTPDGGCLASGGSLLTQVGFRYSRLSPAGNLEWAKSLELGHPTTTLSAANLAGGGYLVVGEFWNSQPSGILFKVSPNGSPIWGKSFGFKTSYVGEFPNGQILVAGLSDDGMGKPVFVRLTAQGDVVWAKAVENTGAVVIGSAAITPDGSILFRTGVEGALIGFLKMDGNGSLEWARGFPAGNYAFGSPIATQDGGYAFLIPSYIIDSAGQAGLVKTDAEGLLPGCEAVDLCIDIVDFTTQTANLSWVENDVTYDTAFQSFLTPLGATVEDYCPPIEIPIPDFLLPDSICAGASVSPGGLAQAGAGSWAWTFEGGSPGTSTEQAPTDILFSNPGSFEVGQVIRFGGCPDSFSLHLTVLPAPLPDLGPDTLLCSAESYLLDGATPGAISYLWDDGSTTPTRLATANGIYSLWVSTEFCESEGSVTVRFFEQTYPDAKLDLGPDSAVCEGSEYVLEAILPGADFFIWENGSDSPIRIVGQAGTYSATAFLENCPLSDEVEISFIDCDGKVYVPTAFSPNADGINDAFRPFGKDVVFKNLKIFDRWGALVFDADGPLPAWDGTVGGRPANPGHYVFLLKYEHLLTGEVDVLKGGLHLVR
jgi:gliding motility-associated-like protein